MTVLPGVILASGSPRRARILRDAGIAPHIVAPSLDDADAPTDMHDPCAHVMSLAWFKARLVLQQVEGAAGAGLPRWLVAADTMCVLDGRIIGKPAGVGDMLAMLRSMMGRTHEVVTGVCVMDRSTGARRLFFDSASVHLGHLDDVRMEAYAASGEWHGKAGGYNYQDRVDAGWPLRCEGDPETVMGLPSRLVLPAVGVTTLRHASVRPAPPRHAGGAT